MEYMNISIHIDIYDKPSKTKDILKTLYTIDVQDTSKITGKDIEHKIIRLFFPREI